MSKGPVHVIRFGLIKVCIWKNHTAVGDRYTITVVRLFKNGDIWKESSRFGRDDLPLVAKACDLAHTWVYQEGQQSAPAQPSNTSTRQAPTPARQPSVKSGARS